MKDFFNNHGVKTQKDLEALINAQPAKMQLFYRRLSHAKKERICLLLERKALNLRKEKRPKEKQPLGRENQQPRERQQPKKENQQRKEKININYFTYQFCLVIVEAGGLTAGSILIKNNISNEIGIALLAISGFSLFFSHFAIEYKRRLNLVAFESSENADIRNIL